MQKGDVLIAKHTTKFPDYITAGNEYTVTSSYEIGGLFYFHIINDRGVDWFPVSTSFTKKEATQ